MRNANHFKSYYAVPAGINYPAPLAKLLKAYEAAWESYETARISYEEANTEATRAGEADKTLLVESVAQGKGDPGEPNQGKADRAVKYADELVNHHASIVDMAQAAIEAELPKHTDVLVREAIKVERSIIAAYITALEQAQASVTRAEGQARTLSEAINFVAPLTRETLGFHASATIDEVIWPNARFAATGGGIGGLLNELERFYGPTESPKAAG